MTQKIVGTVLLVVFSFCNCTAQDRVKSITPDSISGTWTRMQKLDDGSSISIMKIITPTHFAAFQKDAAGAKQELFQAHSGSYTLDNGVMNEKYSFSSNPQIIGTSAQCQVTIDGDTLRQTWKANDGRTAVEIWTREVAKPKEKTITR